MTGRGLGRARVTLWVAITTTAIAAGACTTTGSGRSAGVLPALESPTTVGSGPDGPFAVGERVETFVDDSRPTDPNGTAPGKPDRTLDTVIFYPAEGAPGGDPLRDAPARRAGAPYPLVVFSHGFTAHGDVYRNLVRWWAAAGYVVAAPTFPLSSGRSPGGPRLADYRNQPADVSFVIDEMLRINRDPSHLLAGTMDGARVGVSGHSLGGLTTFGVAFNECCVDRRIKAAIPMSGLRLPFGGSRYFPAGVDTPVLIIHGDQDAVVPVDQGRSAFADAQAPKYLLLLQGEDHVIPFVTGRSTPAGSLVIDGSIDFLDRYLKGRADGIARLEAAVRAEGKAELQRDAA
jgi:predicted dienelactone hydrolase